MTTRTKIKLSLSLKEKIALVLYRTSVRLMPVGFLQDARVHPISNRPPRNEWSLARELDKRQSEKLSAKTRIDWDAVAVQCFQKWLARNQDRFPEQYEAFMGDDKYINEQLADAAKAIFTGYYQRQLAARKS